MRLYTFSMATSVGSISRMGVELNGKILDLNAAGAAYYDSLGEYDAYDFANFFLPADMLTYFCRGEKAKAEAAKVMAFVTKSPEKRGPKGETLFYGFNEITLEAPVKKPNIIWDHFLYIEHVKLAMKNIPQVFFDRPIYATQPASTVVGTGAPIIKPRFTNKLDFELELGFFIGKKGKDIPQKDALNYVAGFTIYNDISARDVQAAEMEMTLGPAKGKHWEHSNIMGPCVVTPDEIGDFMNLRMRAYVNGELVSDDNSGKVTHTLQEMIAFMSQETYLYPGDFFGFGTTDTGTGPASKLKRFLNVGDTVKFEVENIGSISNTVIAG